MAAADARAYVSLPTVERIPALAGLLDDPQMLIGRTQKIMERLLSKK
jgi:hypothetical protein